MRNLILLLLIYFASSTAVLAHKPSDSFINIDRSTSNWQLRWDIALRDLEYAIGLDRDQNGQVTRGEVINQSQDISAYALSKLQITVAGKSCPTPLDKLETRQLEDGSYASLFISVQCPSNGNAMLEYSLFFDFDPTHRGLVSIRDNNQTLSHVLSESSRRLPLDQNVWSNWAVLYNFIHQGVWHIWTGYDHILFLLTLLLPAVLYWKNDAWQSVDRLNIAVVDTLKIVTAFTLAHSITLALASLQIVTLPSRFVESMIAFSVLITAINNLMPVFRGSRWMVAFCFGLIHGFGFANVLLDLGLQTNQIALSLLGFNIGVEIGQLVIVAVILPLAFLMRGTFFYRWGLLRAGSTMVAFLSMGWLVERLFDYRLTDIL